MSQNSRNRQRKRSFKIKHIILMVDVSNSTYSISTFQF